MSNLIARYKNDLSAGIVVFFVALPLCLGIALASGAPLFSGVIAGIVGGIVIGLASKSPVGVSGPAAGLVVIVLNAIEQLGSWEIFLVAVTLAGVLQLLMGFARLGIIAYYFPSSVIKGMLTGIGVLIIMKQLPYAIGYHGSSIDTPLNLHEHFDYIVPGAAIIGAVSMAILILWDNWLGHKHRMFQVLQGPLVVVIVGILLNRLLQMNWPDLAVSGDQLVNLPVSTSAQEFFGQFRFPDFSALRNVDVYIVAATIAIVASLETLLCVEATDKLDPYKRITPTDRELKAQGLGNVISGLIGGLPLTQVIVRSSANISFGGRTKVSAIFHGILLLICAVSIPTVLNMIPLAALACVLIVVGYKLAKPKIFAEVYRHGWVQFVPFVATVLGVVFLDLLKGIAIGVVIAVLFILRNLYSRAFEVIFVSEVSGQAPEYRVVLAEDVTFLGKANLLGALNRVPNDAKVILDGTASKAIDRDIVEILENFKSAANERNIAVETVGFSNYKLF